MIIHPELVRLRLLEAAAVDLLAGVPHNVKGCICKWCTLRQYIVFDQQLPGETMVEYATRMHPEEMAAARAEVKASAEQSRNCNSCINDLEEGHTCGQKKEE